MDKNGTNTELVELFTAVGNVVESFRDRELVEIGRRKKGWRCDGDIGGLMEIQVFNLPSMTQWTAERYMLETWTDHYRETLTPFAVVRKGNRTGVWKERVVKTLPEFKKPEV